MKKGISLVSLIITIIVIIILASISVFSSLDTVNQSQLVKSESEFRDVCTWVQSISTRVEAELLELNLTKDTLINNSQIAEFYSSESIDFSSEEQDKILALNDLVEDSNPNRGYHYIEGKLIENDAVPGLEGISTSDNTFTVPNKVQNNYIINFYYGTVIAKVSPDKTLVSGPIK